MSTHAAPIVVIDDEKDIGDLVKLMLEDLGYEVFVCLSGEEGIELIQSRGKNIQLILLDLAMPGISGIDVLERVKQDIPEVPVIVMSGYVVEQAEAEALGARGILQKPFLLDDVETQVRAILDRD